MLQFVGERCTPDPDATVRLSHSSRYGAEGLFTAYRDWCRDNGFAPMGRGKFQSAIEAKVPGGVWERDVDNVTVFRGLRLRA